MKILSVIGTRPQYIKYAPLYKRFLNYSEVSHLIYDTNQHYSDSVSKNIIDSVGLKIDGNIRIDNRNSLGFISSAIIKISSLLDKEKPDCLFTIGDTNSTFSACIAAHKLGIRTCHIEAGARSKTMKEEEINRQYADSISEFKFSSSLEDLKNISGGVYSGDLEYEMLNQIDPKISSGNFSILTIHRKENMTKDRFDHILSFLGRSGEKILFVGHHTPISFIRKNNIVLPDNISLIPAQNYIDMVNLMSGCKNIFTDSGGLLKTAPFFGKKCVVLRDDGEEWSDTYKLGIAKRFVDEGVEDFISTPFTERYMDFYMKSGSPSSIIVEEVIKRMELK